LKGKGMNPRTPAQVNCREKHRMQAGIYRVYIDTSWCLDNGEGSPPFPSSLLPLQTADPVQTSC